MSSPSLSIDVVPSREEDFSPSVTKRDGRVVPFDGERIRVAVEKAFRATHSLSLKASLPENLTVHVSEVVGEVIAWCGGRESVEVEQIQDEVERTLMRREFHAVARRYVLYREARQRKRQKRVLRYRSEGDSLDVLPEADLRGRVVWACDGLPDADAETVFALARESFYDGMQEPEVRGALVLAARALIEREPVYTYVAARLLLANVYDEVVRTKPDIGGLTLVERPEGFYRDTFQTYLRRGIEAGRLDERLLSFDLDRLAQVLRPDRDRMFTYLGAQTLYDRYLLQVEGRRIELPQWLWMRVAMGLALNEDKPEARAEEFYELLSTFRFMCSTPTLFNSGTPYSQLSSCYLTTVADDLGDIFKSIRDNALLSKWAGGLGNDWTPVRALGAHIRGTDGQSQGVIPFLKVANDTAVAVNQGGKRNGAVCAYLETWHLDIEEFLELRRNTGDERRRTHDMNTANWIPDLFIQRVIANEGWTLFSPDEVPDLHNLTGRAFRERYQAYERQADEGGIKNWKRVEAVTLWRKMLSMLFETGHPWLTFKDACNIRSPQDHVGTVHSSNLCTEITLNTSAEETAVCNLGSVNLITHLKEGAGGGDVAKVLDLKKLEKTITTAVRMLDNVIDLNFYPTEEARNSNIRHRPVGLGMMGFQDVLHCLELSYAGEEAVGLADSMQEAISLYAINASAGLAKERGAYESYPGSKWDRGIFPLDTLDLLEQERGERIPLDQTSLFEIEWPVVRENVAENGMRNSNVMAIAPTATISNICGVSQSVEPAYKNLYVKSNLSGEFTQVNTYLVEALKGSGLWDDEMLDDLKYFDGSLAEIDRVPDEIKERFKTAFEIEPEWLIECAARRQKWIDQAQSLNLYVAKPSGRKLSKTYQLAWKKGLKTTYYLRALAATQVEKSTIDVNRRGFQPRWMKNESASGRLPVNRVPTTSAVVVNGTCAIDDPDCEACQ